ncbi:uncharacterized protein LOC141666187 [Apium graveolens]|uniref:uncharacterized protein LOC141666187 n=1 Tax=Apium graveolens TaxID=4045 RepID=UPI003D7A6080
MDKIALAMIYHAIPEEMLLSFAAKRTSKEAWDALKIMCQEADRVKAARIQKMKADFESLSMKESELVDDICMRLNGLVTNIRVLGEEVSESYVVKKLLRSVPKKFPQITSTIEQFVDLDKMTVEEAVASLKAQRKIERKN